MMQMFRAHCRDCQWIFDVIVLPLPVTIAARGMKGACCPMCGNRTGNTVAEARALYEAERAHKTRLEAERPGGAFNLCPPQGGQQT